MKKLLFLALLIAVTFCSYLLHQFIKKKIDPRLSAANFFLYFAAHILVIFLLVSIAGLVVIHFKDFFFK
ncbi:MAG: hypothetical protein ABJA78_12710 [Ferruginibacter sp.]